MKNLRRGIVYQTDRWQINIKPVFIKEIRGLFGNIYPGNYKYHWLRNFYRGSLSIYFLLFCSYLYFQNQVQNNSFNTMKKIEVGDQVPQFSLQDQNGKPFKLDSVLGKKNLVIYFYPKDDSPGCTKEACSFRDQFDVFRDEDAIIIGISGQSVASHLDFANKHHLNFTLLSDPGNKVRKLFGVPASLFGLLPGRVTYIVNKKGEVVYIFNSQLQAQKHVQEALEILKKMR